MAYTFLTSSKLLILSLWFSKMFEVYYSICLIFSKLPVGRCPQIDLVLSNPIWSKLQKGVSKPCQLQRKKIVVKYVAFVDTNGCVKKLTLFLPGLALLQSPGTKYLVA
jgi:hypothetical protein